MRPAALHGSGLIHAVVPPWVANTAMVALGAVVGARFTNTPLRLMANFLGAAFGSFALSVTIAGGCSRPCCSTMFALPIPEVMIAFAPGSVDAMMLLALALHLDPVYVGAHHVTRIVMVSLSMPLIARRVAHKPQGRGQAAARAADVSGLSLFRRQRLLAVGQAEPVPHVGERFGERGRSARRRDRATA